MTTAANNTEISSEPLLLSEIDENLVRDVIGGAWETLIEFGVKTEESQINYYHVIYNADARRGL